MLKIGDFSRLSMINIRMLRYFDEKNVLKPYKIDLENNYRYYLESQLVTACKIKSLQDMGFTISEIRDILLDGSDLEKVVLNQKNKLLEEQQNILSSINSIDLLLAKINKGENMNYSVVVKEIPSLKVLSYRTKINKYKDEFILWKEINDFIIKNNVKLADPCYSMAIFHDLEYKENNIDVEAQIAIEREYESSDTVKVLNRNSLKVLSITFKGDYSQIQYVNEAAASYALTNKYEFAGPMFNIYHISPATENNPDNYITESCFPIK